MKYKTKIELIGRCVKVKNVKEISGFKGNHEALSVWIGMLRSEELFGRNKNFIITAVIRRKKKDFIILQCPSVSQDAFITPVENVKL